MLLDSIKGVGDIKYIDPDDYQDLAQEIREFLIDKNLENRWTFRI